MEKHEKATSVEAVRVVVSSCTISVAGEVESREEITLYLDPATTLCNQTQQKESELDENGDVVGFKSVGCPYLVVQGVVRNQERVPLSVDPPSELEAYVNVEGGCFVLGFLWQGRKRAND